MKENLVEILRQLLAGLQRNLWYTISTTSSYEYNLQAATILVSKYGPVSFFLDETVRARTERTYVLLTF